MKEIINGNFRVFIGQGYERAILREHGENWLLQWVQKIINILYKADAEIELMSIVFDRRMKKAAWFKNCILCVNLAYEEKDLWPALRQLKIPIYTSEEITQMKEELTGLRKRYFDEDEDAGKKYLDLAALIAKFTR
ncbi:MAG: hypothetical protein Q7R53_00905 [bacterium]|nr:hypothetical protein [bacterium]